MLISYAGSTITTDTIGNTLWDGLFSYTWQNGRQLASATRSGMSVSYQYNADGIRTSKTVNGILHTYDLSGSSIVRECIYNSTGTYVATELRYYYDAKGAPAAMHVFKKANANATPQEFVCYFATNLQGDVVALYDEDGNRIASYTYDAWGNNIHKQHYTADIIENATDAQWLMNINPFRYRGYYYDTETGLYYLQSRYYNPLWGRFINADVYINANGDLIGYNMYAYCSNNPIMYKDTLGSNRVDTIDTLMEPLGFRLVLGLLIVTVKDLVLLSDLSYTTEKGTEMDGSVDNIHIKDSYQIVTPWVQWGYSCYLNHVNEDTKDLIKGSTTGFQFEWMIHNIAYYGASIIGLDNLVEPARSVDVGNTIYDDSHGKMTDLMTAAYFLSAPLFSLIDKFVYNQKQRSEN